MVLWDNHCRRVIHYGGSKMAFNPTHWASIKSPRYALWVYLSHHVPRIWPQWWVGSLLWRYVVVLRHGRLRIGWIGWIPLINGKWLEWLMLVSLSVWVLGSCNLICALISSILFKPLVLIVKVPLFDPLIEIGCMVLLG